MTGWKTWTGGIGLICTGVGTCIAALCADPVDWVLFGTGITTISGGITAIGIGHKVEKSKG